MGEDVLSFTDTVDITGVFTPATGVLTLSGSDTVANYETALRNVRYENTSDAPSTLSRTVTWTAMDGVETSAPVTSTIDVTAVNDPPVLTAGATLDYTENDPPTAIDTTITVVDPDDADLESATAQITGNYVNGEDVLSFTNMLGITGVWTPATGTLALSGTSSKANYQTALRSVAYENTSDDPSTLARTVTWIASDGSDSSVGVTSTINVTAVNDPPVAGDDAWDTIGNTQLVVDLAALPTPHVLDTTTSTFGVLDDDADPAEGDALVVSGIVGCGVVTPPFVCPTVNGGSVTMEANGRFTFTPLAGDAAASDSFQYTVTDDGTPVPASATATVTINLFEQVWYVENDAAAGGLGRSHDPFDTLGEAQTASVANDWIFVYFGDGTSTGQAAGIVLKNGQRLIGEHAGLSIPVNLNGNGSPTVLHTGTPGSRPLINHSGAGNNAVSATDAIPIEIVGLSLMSSGGGQNGIDVTTQAAFAGSGTLSIRDNVVRGAVTEGIDVSHAGTGALTLAVHDNTVTAGSRGIDLLRTSGTMTITRLDDNVVMGDTGGSGIEIAGAILDATPGTPINQVAGGVTVIGQFGNGVGGSGLLLTSVTGDLTFTDLDIWNDGGNGLRVTSTGALNAAGGTGFRIVVPASMVTIDSNGGPAVDVNNASVTLPLSFLESTSSTTTGLSLVNAFGGVGQTALSVSSGQISDPGGASGNAVNIDGGNGNITIGVPITNNSGRAVSIANRTGDTVAFTGAITETGSGLSMTSNTGATMSYRGGLSASTGTNGAFSATGGGNVEVCDENPCSPGATGGLVNTLTTTTGTSLNVANTTITTNRLEFRSISSNGATNGIVLNTTGTGGLKVSGNSAGTCGGSVSGGGATVGAPNAADCTGGSIVASTGPGVLLSNTANISLTRVRVANGGDDGIRGASVSSLSLTSSLVENNGNAVGERGIEMTELTGSGGISSSTIKGSAEANVTIANDGSGSLTAFNVTNSQITTTSVATGDDGILVLNTGTGAMNISVTESAFTDNKGDHFQAASDGAASTTGSINLTFSNNTLLTTPANDPNVIGGGITINPGGGADISFTISNNNIQQAFDDAININHDPSSTAQSHLSGTIHMNTIGTAGQTDSGSESSNTITVGCKGAGTNTIAVTNNTLREWSNQYGIFIGISEGPASLNATVTGNNLADPGTFALNGIRVDAGATAGPPADNGTLCVGLTGNTAAGSGLATEDIRLRQRFSTTIRLPGYAGANSDTAAVNTFVSGNNGGATTSSAHNVGGDGGGFVGGAACPTP
jgi:hypothetical protein